MDYKLPVASATTRRNLLLGMAGVLAAPALQAEPISKPRRPGRVGRSSVDMERFVQDCIEASKEGDAQGAVKDVLARAVRDPGAMLAAVGEPTRAGITPYLRSPTLTIFSAAWTPQMNLLPHNHEMWALIGIYTGREDNILWRRADGRGLKAYGADCLFEGDVGSLPNTAIHSVTNPLQRFTGGIHIYGGDFFNTTRTQWDPETLKAEPSDGDVIRTMFERENERWSRAEKE